MSGVALDWSSAEVHDGTLEVGLNGERPKGWKESFERTVALLHGRNWTIELKKDRVRVQDVAQGSEDRVRHFLESVVLQANADHEETRPDPREEPEAEEDEADEPEGPDVEMTERFRSFADGADD
jgi:hypothetical protein